MKLPADSEPNRPRCDFRPGPSTARVNFITCKVNAEDGACLLHSFFMMYFMITMMPFGIHKGRLLRDMVFKYPSYALFLSKVKNPHTGLRGVVYAFHNMIATFDDKAFVEKCSGNKCKRIATRCYLCKDTATLLICCKGCASTNTHNGHFKRIRKFEDAIIWIEKFYWDSKQKLARKLIKQIGTAKGLPESPSRMALRAFLGDGEIPPNMPNSTL